MSLATREQKAVVTDFCACRAFLLLLSDKKEIKEIRLSKERLTGHRGVKDRNAAGDKPINHYTFNAAEPKP